MLLDALCQIALCCYLRICCKGAPNEVSWRMQEFMFLAALCSLFFDISAIPELVATSLIIQTFPREHKIKVVEEDCKTLAILSILAVCGSLCYVYEIFPLFVVLCVGSLRAVALIHQCIQLHKSVDQPHYMQSYLFTYVWVSIFVQSWRCASHDTNDWLTTDDEMNHGYADIIAALNLAIWTAALVLRGAKRMDNNAHHVDSYEGNLSVSSIIAKIDDTTIKNDDGEGNEREKVPLSLSAALYALEVGPLSDEKLKFPKWFWVLRLVVLLVLRVVTIYFVFAGLASVLVVLTFAISPTEQIDWSIKTLPVAFLITAILCCVCKAKRTPDESSSSSKEDDDDDDNDDDIETAKTTSGIKVFWLQDSLEKHCENREEAKTNSQRMNTIFRGVIILLALFALATLYTRGEEVSFWSPSESVTVKGGGLVNIDHVERKE